MSRLYLYDFVTALFSSIARMEAEALPARDGTATGLSYYGKHRHPDQVKPQTEPSWTQRLRELLREAGYSAEKECRYPDVPGCSPANSCDNVITFTNGQ